MLLYGDNFNAVMLCDRVRMHIENRLYEGIVIARYPRLGLVRVLYMDDRDITERGDPRAKGATFPAHAITLVARDS